MSHNETLTRVRVHTCAMAIEISGTFLLQTSEEGKYAVPLDVLVPGCDDCNKTTFNFIKWRRFERYLNSVIVLFEDTTHTRITKHVRKRTDSYN